MKLTLKQIKLAPKNRKKETRFIIEIVKESKKGELQYGWASEDGVTSICSEKTLVGWMEK